MSANETVRKYLKDFFTACPRDDLFVEEVKEQEKELEALNILTPQEAQTINESLVYSLYEKGFKADEIAQAFQINARQVSNIHAKKNDKTRNIKKDKISKHFRITQEIYDELEVYMSNKNNRLATLNKMRTHLIDHFALPNRKIALFIVSNMLKRLSFSRKRIKKQAVRRNIIETIEEKDEMLQQNL